MRKREQGSVFSPRDDAFAAMPQWPVMPREKWRFMSRPLCDLALIAWVNWPSVTATNVDRRPSTRLTCDQRIDELQRRIDDLCSHNVLAGCR